MITKGISGEASVLDLEEPNKLSVRFTNVPITGKYDIWGWFLIVFDLHT